MQDTPLFQEHEVKNRADYRDFAVPLSLHMDGTPVTGIGKPNSQSEDIYSWSSITAIGSTIDILFFIFAIFTDLIAKSAVGNTMDVFWRRLIWSMWWLWLGVWPDEDDHGVKYTMDNNPSAFLKKLKPLAGGFFGVLWVNKCDLDFLPGNWDYLYVKADHIITINQSLMNQQ